MKGRTAAESVTLPRRAVRLLEQWLEHAALTRRHAPAGLAAAVAALQRSQQYALADRGGGTSPR